MQDFLAGSKASRAQFVETLGGALHKIGFFALENHGVHSELIERAYTVAKEFFALPEEHKLRYDASASCGARGYTAFGKEKAKGHHVSDMKEFWHVGREIPDDHPLRSYMPKNLWPTELPEFRSIMLELYRQLDLCASRILEACALYLDERPDLFSEHIHEGNSLIRVINYPAMEENVEPGRLRAAKHEDINYITLLCEATDGGLELEDQNGNWLPIHALKGQIIVDSADMLQRITNGFYRATPHRVVNTDGCSKQRLSMPYFCHPKPTTNLAALPSCLAKTGGKKLFPDCTAQEYLEERLREIKLK